MFSLLGRKNYKLTDFITIHIPTIGEIRRTETSEAEYYQAIFLFTKTQCDLMVELDEMGINYTQIDNYEIFISQFGTELKHRMITDETWNLLFENFDLSNIQIYERKIDKQIVFGDKQGNIIIDKNIFESIADIFRQITFQEKNDEYLKVPEESTRKYIIERAKIKRERNKNKFKNVSSQFDGYILLLVNNCNFKYDFQTVNNVSIYDFYCSFKQIFKDKEIDGLMSAYWAGNIKSEDLTENKLNRIII